MESHTIHGGTSLAKMRNMYIAVDSFCSNVLKHVLGRTWKLPLRRTSHECCWSLFFSKCTIRNITLASVSNFICIETWTDAVIVASKRQLKWWIKWMKQNGKNEQSNILQISQLKGAVSRNPSELATTLTDNKCLKKLRNVCKRRHRWTLVKKVKTDFKSRFENPSACQLFNLDLCCC